MSCIERWRIWQESARRGPKDVILMVMVLYVILTQPIMTIPASKYAVTQFIAVLTVNELGQA